MESTGIDYGRILKENQYFIQESCNHMGDRYNEEVDRVVEFDVKAGNKLPEAEHEKPYISSEKIVYKF